MAGFGHDPFGKYSFGHVAWSRVVLFDLLPSIYRELDVEQGGVLETWTDVLRPTFDSALALIRNWEELRDPKKVRTRYSETVEIRLGAVKDPDSGIEQRGIDGVISTSRTLTSKSGRFKVTDVGKKIEIIGSAVEANNRVFQVSSVINTHTITCNPPLIADGGPIRWVLKGFPVYPEGELAIEVRGGDVSNITPGWVIDDGASTYEVIGRKQFYAVTGETRSLTEREGSQGEALGDGRFSADIPFLQKDVGKFVTLSGSTTHNNGKWQIFKVDKTDSRIVTLHEPLLINGEDYHGGVIYTLNPVTKDVYVSHIISGFSSSLEVEVTGNSIEVYLATDSSGLPISTASEVMAAVSANTAAAQWVTVSVQGTGASKTLPKDKTLVRGVRLEQGSAIIWALLPFPELRISSLNPPFGVIEQEGEDLEILGTYPSQVYAPSGRFTDEDIGKWVNITNSAVGSDGLFQISSRVDESTVVVDTPLPFPGETSLGWQLRHLSDEAESANVTARAPSLIEFLAGDFDLDIDERDTDSRQRAWVEGGRQWFDYKAASRGYEVVAALSGYNVEISGLYRLSKEYLSSVSSVSIWPIDEFDVESRGADGALTLVGGRVRLSSATGDFTVSHEGLSFRVSNCANVSNNGKSFEIETVISESVVEARAEDTGTAPDYGLGGTVDSPTVNWQLVRLYSTELPTSSVWLDEINVELMQDIVGVNNFLIDSSSRVDEFTVDLISTSPTTATGNSIYFNVTVSGVLQPVTGVYSTVGVILDSKRWMLIDSVGTEFFVETTPILISSGPPEVYTFKVLSNTVPVPGIATLRYLEHEFQTVCGFCRSSSILCRITETSLPEFNFIYLASAPLTRDSSDAIHINDALDVVVSTLSIRPDTDALVVQDDVVILLKANYAVSAADTVLTSDSATALAFAVPPDVQSLFGSNLFAYWEKYDGSAWQETERNLDTVTDGPDWAPVLGSTSMGTDTLEMQLTGVPGTGARYTYLDNAPLVQGNNAFILFGAVYVPVTAIGSSNIQLLSSQSRCSGIVGPINQLNFNLEKPASDIEASIFIGWIPKYEMSTASLKLWQRDYSSAGAWAGTASAGTSGSVSLNTPASPVVSEGVTINGHKSCEFDSASDYISAGNAISNYISASSWRVSLLVGIDSFANSTGPADFGARVIGNILNPNWGISVYGSGSSGAIYAWHRDAGGVKSVSYSITVPYTCTVNAWYDGTSIYLSVNGLLAGSNPAGNITAGNGGLTGELRLGSSVSSFIGRIWDVALTNNHLTYDADTYNSYVLYRYKFAIVAPSQISTTLMCSPLTSGWYILVLKGNTDQSGTFYLYNSSGTLVDTATAADIGVAAFTIADDWSLFFGGKTLDDGSEYPVELAMWGLAEKSSDFASTYPGIVANILSNKIEP